MATADEWLGEASTSYDPDEFYVTSIDKRGHGEKFYIKVPQHIPGEISAIVARLGCYRTNQDFVRDAIVHRLMALKDRFPELEEMSFAFVEELIAESVQARVETEISILQKYERVAQIAEGPIWRAEIAMRANMAASAIANPRIAQRLRELG